MSSRSPIPRGVDFSGSLDAAGGIGGLLGMTRHTAPATYTHYFYHSDEVWERNKAPDGNVYDSSGVRIKPGEYWELGHRPGHQLPDARLRAAQEGWDRATWRKYQMILTFTDQNCNDRT